MDYYRNKSTGHIFISLNEGETLINPAGKQIPLNDSLFEELDDAVSITEAQQKVAKDQEAFETTQVEVVQNYKEKTTRVVFNGCKMSLRDQKEVEAGEKVIVLDGKRHFKFISTEGLTEDEIEQAKAQFIKVREFQEQRRVADSNRAMDDLQRLINRLMNR